MLSHLSDKNMFSNHGYYSNYTTSLRNMFLDTRKNCFWPINFLKEVDNYLLSFTFYKKLKVGKVAKSLN